MDDDHDDYLNLLKSVLNNMRDRADESAQENAISQHERGMFITFYNTLAVYTFSLLLRNFPRDVRRQLANSVIESWRGTYLDGLKAAYRSMDDEALSKLTDELGDALGISHQISGTLRRERDERIERQYAEHKATMQGVEVQIRQFMNGILSQLEETD